MKKPAKKTEDYPYFLCPQCFRKSYHPKDIEQRYCGHCKAWFRHGEPAFKTAACRCPTCRAPLDAATNADPGVIVAPVPGDITVCLHCASVLIFDDKLTPREPTDAERAAFPGDLLDTIAHAQAIVSQIQTKQ